MSPIISGDNPHTVGAVATKMHLSGVQSAADGVDPRTLPEDVREFAEVLENHGVFGRVTLAPRNGPWS